MLSAEANERLTRVGVGTPCGELMRRYWIPIAPYAQLLEDPVRKVRVLGEDLVLYQNTQGGLGLIGDRCLHRLVDLQWGIPDTCGLRCPYHGWLYDETGRISDNPMRIGYARISKADGSQVLDLQRDALVGAGISPEHIYENKASGKDDDRPALAACLKAL